MMAVKARRGRPRKVNVHRDSTGKSRGEVVDFSVVFNQPHRKHAKDPKSELLGYPLGRLRLSGQISETQLRAGNEWAQLVKAYSGTMGLPSGSPRSGSLLNDSGKVGHAFALDEATHDAEERDRRTSGLRNRYMGCFDALSVVGHSLGLGRAILMAMRAACIEERYPNETELGNLRIGLNVIAREMRIEE